MKKLTKLMLFLMAGASTVFVSCNKDDDENTDKSPTINFVGGSGYVDANVQLTVNDAFKVGITASSNATSSTKLVSFKVVRTANNTPVTVLDSTISTKTFGTWTGNFTAQSTATTENWTFTVTDADGESATATFTIQTVAAGPISTYTAKQAGAQSNSTLGSFIDLTGGNIYLSSAAVTNQANVDAVYFNGAGNATIGSVTDSEAKGIFSTLPFTTTNNQTTFVDLTSSMSTSQFDAITDDSGILNALGTPTATQISGLAVNSIVGFKTADGKYGLVKVTALTAGNTGSMTCTIKVQQ
ncbi:MAG: hypothetical protein H6585_10750 [Flavobacteriales bacterium]|nr:hypothetical protein [Flavobacteriales bacterium]MCB9448811.1 hypothetical protein [Flavobacteriales bacterium]